ncbi:MAG: PD40 domain-containing protein [Cyclobacteriaceae bacterium]|nr:PD40 domain-containing protein [Cyclobacteriaceae bacterium]
MKLILTFSFVLMMVAVSAQKNVLSSFNLPPKELALFGEGIISTHLNERDFAISPDGSEIYFTISTPKSTFQTIVSSKRNKQGWSTPEVVSFAGEFSDLEPVFSMDGQTLYFASNRPTSGSTSKDFDLWKVKRVGAGWGTPENLGTVINTNGDEFYPSITKSGNLYFTAAYKDGPGREDIYFSEFRNGEFAKPIALDSAVNTKFYEFNAFVDQDEKYLLFTSYGRKDDTGGGDLYLSIKDSQGKWQHAKNLKTLNSKQLDYCPYLTNDGRALFFTSERHQLPSTFSAKRATYKDFLNSNSNPLNGTGNIYWIDFQEVLDRYK